jgi:hypothetical protein
MDEVIYRRKDCRACGSKNIELFFSLKPTPIGDAYIAKDKKNIHQPSYPIDLFMCNDCGLAQLPDVINSDVLYQDYIYNTSSSFGLNEHFRTYSEHVVEKCRLEKDSLVVDLGSNDGTLLNFFQKNGMNVLGIEPASHIADLANRNGVRTINGYFNPQLVEKIIEKYGKPKLITSNNVFANIDDLNTWVASIKALLHEQGVYVFESYYLSDLIDNMVFDFIYHEHISSFSVRPIKSLFKKHGLELFSVERVPTKGGSLRYYVQHTGGVIEKEDVVEELIKFEDEKKLYEKATYNNYAKKIDGLKQQALAFLKKAKEDKKTIAGFGASITGTTLIYHFEIGQYIDYLIDDNIAKQGRFSPGHHLPVFPTNVIYDQKPDYVIILAWRFANDFLLKNKTYLDNGGECVIPVPEFKVIRGVK